MNFKIVEQPTNLFEEVYQEFKKIWLSNPKITKTGAFRLMDYSMTHPRMKYINTRMMEDELPEHYPSHGRCRKDNKLIRAFNVDPSEYEEKYQEYKKLFYTTDLLCKNIYKRIGVSNNSNYCAEYIRSKCIDEGLDGQERLRRIRCGDWI